MKLLKIYSWLAGTMNDFTTPFRGDETLYNQATVFWRKLDNGSISFVIAMLVIGIILAYCYYGPFNNLPGRSTPPMVEHHMWCCHYRNILCYLAAGIHCC